MADIFLSYARQDREPVERLVHALTTSGWSVFWDPSIMPGTHWDNVIEAELKQAKCVVVAWTPQSVSREWVRIEAHHGRSKGILLPVVLESCEIPITFSHIQAEDLTASRLSADDPSFARLLDGLRRIAGAPEQASAAATATAETAGPKAAVDPKAPDTLLDMFAGVFGAEATKAMRGLDLRHGFEISLEEAFSGKTATIELDRAKLCAACGGDGAVLGTSCRACGGAGTVRETREFTVEVPAGVSDGTQIRLAGEGDADPKGGASGDLYLVVAIRRHPVFRVDGADLLMHAPISRETAAAGGSTNLTMIDGARIRVTTPPGARTGQKLRVRGRGMRKLRSEERGDLYVQLEVEGG